MNMYDTVNNTHQHVNPHETQSEFLTDSSSWVWCWPSKTLEMRSDFLNSSLQEMH